MGDESDLTWYVAYGSNMARERLRTYLEGGRPSGALRSYAGSRDPSPPRRSRAVQLPGRLVFAGQSLAWTGGIAFYVPGDEGRVAARAYLMTVEQLSDLVAQETRQPPGTELDVVAARSGSTCELPGRAYDIALRTDDIEDRAAVTITTSGTPAPTAPSPAYLRWICCGLGETYGWQPVAIAAYLGRFPGVYANWTTDRLVGLAESSDAVNAT